jgi:hypothetical protein
VKRATLASRANPLACGLVAVWATLVGRSATAQSFVEETPEDACAAVETLDPADTSRTAEHLRRTCRLQQLEVRLAADRRNQLVAETEARDSRVAAWVESTQPSRVIHPIAVAGYLGTGLSNYGLIFAWNVLRRLELEARIGWRNMTCWNQYSADGADCTRRTIAAGARWYLMDTNFSPFLSGGFAITGSHLQIPQSNADGSNTLLAGDGRAHSVSGGGGLELDIRNARLSVEYVYEHVYYAGANKQGMDMPPSPELQLVWQNSLVQDRHGIRVQAGYAF